MGPVGDFLEISYFFSLMNDLGMVFLQVANYFLSLVNDLGKISLRYTVLLSTCS